MLPFGSFFEELDFDDEPPARERRGPRFGRRDEHDDEPPDHGDEGGRGHVQWQRILILVGAVLILAVGGYWYIQSCQRSAEVDSYRNYVRDANKATTTANRVAKGLEEALISSKQTPKGMQAAFAALAKQQQQVVASVQALKGPGALGELNAKLLEAQQLRYNGLVGISKQLPTILGSADTKTSEVPTEKAATISLLLARILAGDIVYSDSFQLPAGDVLTAKNIAGVAVDPSEYVSATILTFIAPDQMAQRLALIAAAGNPNVPPDGSGKPRGTSIEAVAVNDTQLDPQAVNEVSLKNSGTNLIRVKIKNGGEFQETQVTATAYLDNKPQGKPAIINVFASGTVATVTFPFEPLFGNDKQTIKIVVDPVQGETNQDNNTRSYSVIFKIA